ncbi:MAG: adenylyltransferase/cytidyltransferase family protein [bacterium]
MLERKVIAFGVFDGFHDGHKHFLYEASRQGDFLIVVVARDEVVRHLKNCSPQYSLKERVAALEDTEIADMVIPGDRKIGSWQVLRHERPHIVATGYDQFLIRKSIEDVFTPDQRFFEIVTVSPYKAGRYHSSLLFNDDE